MTDPATAPGALPPDWTQMLDDIQARLEEAIRAAETPTEPEATSSTVPALPEAAAVADKRVALQSRADRAAALVQEAAWALQSGEALLREHLAATESVRGRLAAWAARAIG